MTNGDFYGLLKEGGYTFGTRHFSEATVAPSLKIEVTSGTTVFAMKYRDGILVAGDRRATAGTTVMHSLTEKLIDIDRYSVLAIAGVPATAFEMARVMEHTFKYYRRSQLQEMSLEGKVRALSKLLRENVPAAIQGIGAVVPIYAAYDPQAKKAKIFFYDILGAEFEVVEFATSGSGSPAIRGVLHYQNQWGTQMLSELDEKEAIVFAIRLLETAASFDVATAGVNHEAKIYPRIKLVTEAGVQDISEERLVALYTQEVMITQAKEGSHDV